MVVVLVAGGVVGGGGGLRIESVKTTSIQNESTEVLCRKESTAWDMKIK